VHPAKASDWLRIASFNLSAYLLHSIEEVLSQNGHQDCYARRAHREAESSPKCIADGGTNGYPERDFVVDVEERADETRIDWHIVFEYE
jgi:hypothetical protein